MAKDAEPTQEQIDAANAILERARAANAILERARAADARKANEERDRIRALLKPVEDVLVDDKFGQVLNELDATLPGVVEATEFYSSVKTFLDIGRRLRERALTARSDA